MNLSEAFKTTEIETTKLLVYIFEPSRYLPNSRFGILKK